MVDTVWIVLTLAPKSVKAKSKVKEGFMFGPTGVVRFRRVGNATLLFNYRDKLVAKVKEDESFIMEHLREIRKTGG